MHAKTKVGSFYTFKYYNSTLTGYINDICIRTVYILDYKPNSFTITNITDTKDTPETTLIMWLVCTHTTYIKTLYTYIICIYFI